MSFNHENNYVCVCGREFDNSQSFNGHKGHCKEHQLQKYGNLEKYYNIKEQMRYHSVRYGKKLRNEAQARKQDKLKQWISEKHTCEHCGKIMKEYYGSGRFCCQSCANSRIQTEEMNKKRRKSIKTYIVKQHADYEYEYNKNPNYCVVCKKALPYKYRWKKTCSDECLCQYHIQSAKQRCKELGTNLCGKGLRGHYKGFVCQSSWELAYVIYCLDHSINIIRNKQYFEYILDGEKHLYFPDFYEIDNDTYIEIKGYYDKKSKVKAEQFPYKLKIYKKEEMKPIIKYVEDHYGKDFVKLYDDEKA